MTRSHRGAALLSCLTVLAACGGGSKSGPAAPEDEVRAVIARLGEAARAGKGATICRDLFTENLAISVARASRATCAAEVGENVFARDARYDVRSVRVQGVNASAKTVDQDGRPADLLLQRVDGAWRIARIG